MPRAKELFREEIEHVFVRFLENVDSHDEDNSCWLWLREPTGKIPYGRMRVDNRDLYAHRMAYAYEYSACPAWPLQVDHECRNYLCVRPSHLRLGTQGQNNQNVEGARSHSSTGVRGVFYYPKDHAFQASVANPTRRKSFPIRKLGVREAARRAVAFRMNGVAESYGKFNGEHMNPEQAVERLVRLIEPTTK